MLRAPPRLALLASLAAAGCATVIGFPDYNTGGTTGSGGAGTGGMQPAASVASSTGTATTSTGGSPPACVEGASCYYGLDGTEGVGACKAGTISCEGGVPSCNDVRPAAQSCATGVDGNCDGVSACTGNLRWVKNGLTATTPTTLAAGLDGTVAAVGMTGSTLGDVVVQTFDARGRPCWGMATTFGGGAMAFPADAAISGGALAADGTATQAICNGGGDGGTGLGASTIVVGFSKSAMSFGGASPPYVAGEDAFIAAVDPTGKVAWGTLFGTPDNDRVQGVAIGPKGSVYVTGYVEGPVTLGACSFGAGATSSSPAAFVAMLDAGGACKWAQSFTGSTAGTDIAVVPGGGALVVVGRFVTTLGYGGQSLPLGANNNNTFVVKLSPSDGSLMGSPLRIDAGNADDPRVGVAPNGQVFVAGDIIANSDIPNTECTAQTKQQAYLQPIAPTFALGMPRCYYGTADVGKFGLAVDGAGSVVLALASAGPIQGSQFGGATVGPAVLNVLKLDASWDKIRWAVSGGAIGYAIQTGIAVDGMGDVLVTGADIMPFDPGGASVTPGTFVFSLSP